MNADNPADSSQGNYQLIIIIILVIIGIILFIFVLIESVNFNRTVIAPFADGTIIKIRSLGNNKYLKPIACQDLPNNCQLPGCGISGTTRLVVANAVRGDPGTDWVVCQYKGIAPTNNTQAAYLVYNRASVSGESMSAAYINFGGVLRTDSNAGTCLSKSSINLDPTVDADCNLLQSYFNFILQENVATSNTFTHGGTYQIKTINPSDYGFTQCAFGNNVDYLYSANEITVCSSPVVLLVDSDGGTPNRSSIDETLNFSFFVEVTGRET